MQLFLAGYILIAICEIFTIGGFPLNKSARLVSCRRNVPAMLQLITAQAFTAIHIAAITATSWILMLNGAVGYQLLDDGTAVSVGLLLISSLIIFVGTGYIALDTGFSWTGYWDSTLSQTNQAYALYTLYQLVPLLFIVIFFLLEAFLVLRVLGERKPMRTYPFTFHTRGQLPNRMHSLPPQRRSPLRNRSNLPICHQRPHLHRHPWQN